MHTVRKSRNITGRNICGANNAVERYAKKELNSCMGVFLRADLKGLPNSANQPISAKEDGMALHF